MDRHVRWTTTGWEIHWWDDQWIPLPLTARATITDVERLGARCVPPWRPYEEARS